MSVKFKKNNTPARIIILIHLVGKLYSMDPIHKRNRLIIEYEVLTLETKYKGRKLDNFFKQSKTA